MMRVWVLVCGLVVACGGNPSPEVGAGAGTESGEVGLFARVENLNDYAAEIFAYRNGRWTQLGVVQPGETKTLTFLWDRPEVQFVIELQGNDAITNRQPETDARKTFAADVFGSVPCHLTSAQPVEPGLTLTLQIPPELARNAGGSRCQPRRG